MNQLLTRLKLGGGPVGAADKYGAIQDRGSFTDLLSTTPPPQDDGTDDEYAPEDPNHIDAVLIQLLEGVRSGPRRQFLKLPPTQYSDGRALAVQAVTYNVAGKKPAANFRIPELLNPPAEIWAGAKGRAAAAAAGGAPCGADGPDIVMVGFEEAVPLSAGNVMVSGAAAAGADAWEQVVAATLNGGAASGAESPYVQVRCLQAMRCVFHNAFTPVPSGAVLAVMLTSALLLSHLQYVCRGAATYQMRLCVQLARCR